jgi:hypothetical protein
VVAAGVEAGTREPINSSAAGREGAGVARLPLLPQARELGEILFHVPGKPADVARLKAAAIAMARASELERREVIDAYSWAYGEFRFAADAQRGAGMRLLLKILFVTPESAGNVLHEQFPYRGGGQGWYAALAEYDSFAKRYRMRTVAEIEALEIR